MYDVTSDNRKEKANHQGAWLDPIVTNGLSHESSHVIVKAGLDFEVETRPIYLENGNKVDNYFATVRKDTEQALAVVGSRYVPVQNKDMFRFFDGLAESGELRYETAGALQDGKKIWLLANMPETLTVNVNGKHDEIEEKILLSSSHDGSMSLSALLTPVRVVCMNTLLMAIRNAEHVIRAKHTENAIARIEDQIEFLGLAKKQYTEIGNLFQHFADSKITDEHVGQFVELVLPSDIKKSNYASPSTRLANIRGKVLEIYNTDNTIDRGTIWGVYNAVTGYTDNYKAFTSEDKKLSSILYGSQAQLKKDAQIVATAIASNSMPETITPAIRSDVYKTGETLLKQRVYIA